MELLNIFSAFHWLIDDAIPSFLLILTEIFSFAPPFLQGFLLINLVLIVLLGVLRLITG